MQSEYNRKRHEFLLVNIDQYADKGKNLREMPPLSGVFSAVTTALKTPGEMLNYPTRQNCAPIAQLDRAPAF
jgi:hypothetical protein